MHYSNSTCSAGCVVLRVASAVILYSSAALAIDNGIGVTPPRGWRSWNQFGTGIHQDLIEAQYEALANRSRLVDGAPTSLLDLGYSSAGIDDGWQKCNAGPNGVGFHDARGRPIVDTVKFPSMKAMTAKASSLGITPGFYINNCMCKETRPACASVSGNSGSPLANVRCAVSSLPSANTTVTREPHASG